MENKKQLKKEMTVKTTKEYQELDIERGSLTIQHKYVDLKLLQETLDY